MHTAIKSRSRSTLVLYDPNALATEFVRQHLMAIQRHSRHDVVYAAATFDCRADFPLELFDALIVHFSVRMPFETMSPSFVELVSKFSGPKILLIQDEYDMPRKACALIRKLGISTIFTTVPKPFIDRFYPADEVPNVNFRSCLTGYVPDELPFELTTPLSARRLWLGYRGRKLPIWYGQLGFEKSTIAQRMRAECIARNVPHDIEWEEDKRVNGSAWFRFITSTRAMLGTESGANVMDAWGDIRNDVLAMAKEHPDLSDDELYKRAVAPHENNVIMGQMSPKIFEAIGLKTALILFEGSYSNVIKPDEHYIPLRKDYRNLDDVLKRLADVTDLQEMVDRAYHDVIESRDYGYHRFVSDIDEAIEQAGILGPPRERQLTFALVRIDGQNESWSTVTPHLPLTAPISLRSAPPPDRLLTGRARDLWLKVPEKVRTPLSALLGPPARRVKALLRQ
ncbi:MULTISPECIES: hypothetical protein [Bradyrhizobium]|uniref:hypothetical protein n=1 Tax=Bradyrhizobium TaxID=374 RepID=UPI00209E558B|nr:hypothetical protein [Bradyrhizobium elkanii]MCP1968287.1 hypothetical protein [Bradyrhizobium elkanii]MCS4110212.1 hypothetical protein [Bradyrhizobium elkanii]